MNIFAKVAIAAGASLLTVGCATVGDENSHAQLIDKEWVVEDIAGRGVIDDSRATLLFGADGRLSGQASCNRLIGGYTLKGSKLTISNPGLTMMACTPALMDQETRFVDVLNNVRSYRIDATGALVLTSSSGATITAR